MFLSHLATPESQGISSRHILNMLKRLERQQIPMHGVLIARNSQLIYEGYHKPYYAAKQHRMFSISKSITALAIGHLIDRGLIALDDHIVDYFPEKCPKDVHPWIQAMTIRNMLEMRSCHSATTYKKDLNSDWVASFFHATPDHPAGTVWHYDTSSPHVLCALVEKLTGKPTYTYIKEDVLPQLELSQGGYMLTDPFGVSMGGSGLCCTSMDMMKIGHLLMDEGRWNGEQLIDAAYIRTATSSLNPTAVKAALPNESCGYGYQIWQNERGGFVCYGMGGQLIIVLPKERLVCVTTADTQGYGGGNQYIYDAFYEEVLDHLCDYALPEDEGACQALAQATKALSLPLVGGASSSPQAEAVSGRSYRLLENGAGFLAITLSLEAQKGTLTVETDGAPFHISFGIGCFQEGTLPSCNQYYVANGAWLNEETFYIKCHICDSCIGSLHIQLHFKDDQVTIYERIIEEALSKDFPSMHFIGYLH